MDRGAWQATVHGAAESRTRLCNCLGECVISSVLSHRSKNLKRWTSVTARLQLSFIWQAKENTSLRPEARPTCRMRREEKGSILALLLMFFLLPPGPALCKLASQEGCLLHLRSSLQSSDLPLICFPGLFPPLSFNHRQFGLPFPFLTT